MKQMRVLLLLIVILTSCQKEVMEKHKQTPVMDDFLKGQYNTELRAVSPELIDASKTIRVKNRPKLFAYQNVIYLNFSGDSLVNTDWNYGDAPLVVKYSGLTSDQINNIVDVFKGENAFGSFDVEITTDPNVFYSYDAKHRQKIDFTESWEWFGKVGGTSLVNSRSFGSDDPAFVFTSLLNYKESYIAQAGVHEAGHQLGLVHQSDWVDGVLKKLYSAGITPDHAPFMGISYYDPNGGEWLQNHTTSGNWSILDEYGVFQDDYKIIKQQLGLK